MTQKNLQQDNIPLHDTPPIQPGDRPQKDHIEDYEKKKQDKRLDEASKESFPGSDPVSIQITK